MKDESAASAKRKVIDEEEDQDVTNRNVRGKASQSETSATDVPGDADEIEEAAGDCMQQGLCPKVEADSPTDSQRPLEAFELDEALAARGLVPEVIDIGDAADPCHSIRTAPSSQIISRSETELAAILAHDIYLSIPDREYLSEFFEHLGLRRTSDLLDIDALEPVQQYIRQALLSYECEHGSAGGSVRCALGRLVRELVPDTSQTDQKVKAETPRITASQRKPGSFRVAQVSAKTWTSRRLPGSAMPTVCPIPVKRRFPNKPSLVGLAIQANNLKDRKGNSLPEVRWVVDGNQRVGEVVRRWGIDVLKLPESKLPGGVQGGIPELFEKGISVHGQAGAISLDARLSKIVDSLEPIGGHRRLDIHWPLSSLPRDWGVIKESKKQKKDKHCSDCGDVLTFRRCANDEGVRTFAICIGCDKVKGCFISRKNNH